MYNFLKWSGFEFHHVVWQKIWKNIEELVMIHMNFVGRCRFSRQGLFARIKTDGIQEAMSCIALSKWDTGSHKNIMYTFIKKFEWGLDKPTMLAYRMFFFLFHD